MFLEEVKTQAHEHIRKVVGNLADFARMHDNQQGELEQVIQKTKSSLVSAVYHSRAVSARDISTRRLGIDNIQSRLAHLGSAQYHRAGGSISNQASTSDINELRKINQLTYFEYPCEGGLRSLFHVS